MRLVSAAVVKMLPALGTGVSATGNGMTVAGKEMPDIGIVVSATGTEMTGPGTAVPIVGKTFSGWVYRED